MKKRHLQTGRQLKQKNYERKSKTQTLEVITLGVRMVLFLDQGDMMVLLELESE